MSSQVESLTYNKLFSFQYLLLGKHLDFFLWRPAGWNCWNVTEKPGNRVCSKSKWIFDRMNFSRQLSTFDVLWKSHHHWWMHVIFFLATFTWDFKSTSGFFNFSQKLGLRSILRFPVFLISVQVWYFDEWAFSGWIANLLKNWNISLLNSCISRALCGQTENALMCEAVTNNFPVVHEILFTSLGLNFNDSGW